MEAVNSKVHIRVGSAGVDMDAWREKQGPVMVEQTLRGGNMLISPIQYLPVLKQILTPASPSEGWGIFDRYYQPQAAADKSKLTQQNHSFRIEADRTPQSYFGRFTVLRSELAFHGTIFSDIDAHRHSVRNLSPAFRMGVVCFHPIYL